VVSDVKRAQEEIDHPGQKGQKRQPAVCMMIIKETGPGKKQTPVSRGLSMVWPLLPQRFFS
jgi:hypothetical protein